MAMFWKVLPALVAAAGLILYVRDPAAYQAFCSHIPVAA